MEESINIENGVEICSNGRNEAPMMVVMENFPNHFNLMMVKISRSVRSKWEITKLQFKKQQKDQHAKVVFQYLRSTTI